MQKHLGEAKARLTQVCKDTLDDKGAFLRSTVKSASFDRNYVHNMELAKSVCGCLTSQSAQAFINSEEKRIMEEVEKELANYTPGSQGGSTT